ncbi:MAG: methyltransferase [Candidatus Latescibacterota bacterium]
MLRYAPGPDPYFAYKLHHVDRARTAWVLAEEFGVFEALRQGPSTIPEVSQRTGLQERPVAVLLAASACLGIVGLEQGRHFIHPVMRDMVLEGGRARLRPRPPDPEKDWWYRTMKQAIQTNAPVPEELPPWVAHPDDEANVDVTAFAPERHGWRVLWGEALATAFDFGPFHRVVDLGGATGGVLVGLTGKWSHLQGVVFDLPYSRKTAEAAIAQSGAAERVRFHAGDFFRDPFPEGIDVCFLSHVIHDWDDEHCRQLLARCYQALPAGCPVLAQEFLLNADKSGDVLGVYQWFGLLYGTMGDQRTAAEIQDLMAGVGFRELDCRPIDSDQSIVIGWKR